MGDFIKAGTDDATILMKEFLKPVPTGFGIGLNSGFTESARPKKLFGFSIQLRPSFAMIPSSAQSFDISGLSLNKIRLAPGEDPITPTVSGRKSRGPLMEIYDNPNSTNPQKIAEFRMSGGSGLAYIPAPIVQGSFGLIKKTDITFRFIPEITGYSIGSFKMIGGAIKHDIAQWIPGSKMLPVDISLMIGFNKLTTRTLFQVTPEENVLRNPGDPTLSSNPNPNFDDQDITGETNTFVINALVGKSLPVISGYAGVGFQKASFDVNVTGDYPINTSNLGMEYYNVVTDPVRFRIDSESKFHALAGFRIRLAVLAIYGEVTMASYITGNVGVGISFR